MTESADHHRFMELALAEAAKAPVHGDVPVGAIVVDSTGRVVAADHNRREERGDPTAHAEVLVLAEAARRVGSWRLLGHTLYVTLEPCSMCAGAAVSGRIDRIVYGAADPKAGAVLSLYNIPGDRRLNHQCEIIPGVGAARSAELLRSFFSSKRGGNNG